MYIYTRTLFMIMLALIGFYSSPLLAMQGDVKSTSPGPEAQEKIPLVDLLNSMKANISVEEKKEMMKKFTQFPPKEIEDINPSDISFDQFENIFDNIIHFDFQTESEKEALGNLWLLFMKKYKEVNGTNSVFWKAIPPHATALYTKFLTTDILKSYMSQNQAKAFDKLIVSAPLVHLLNSMKANSPLEEKMEMVKKFTQFPPKEIEDINPSGISFDQFENIFDNIIHYDFQSELEKKCLGELWGVFINKYEEKYRDNKLWTIIQKNSETLYIKFMNTDVLKDNMIPSDKNAFEKIANGPLIHLLNAMKAGSPLEVKKEMVRKLSQFHPNQFESIKTNQFENIKIIDISIDQFENIFDNILKSEIYLPDPIISNIWGYYYKIFTHKYHGEISKDDATIIPPNSLKFYFNDIKSNVLYDNMPSRLGDLFNLKCAYPILQKLKNKKATDTQDSFSNLIAIFSKSTRTNNIVDKTYGKNFIYLLVNTYQTLTINDGDQKLLSQNILPRLTLTSADVSQLKKTLHENASNKSENIYGILNDYLDLSESLSNIYPQPKSLVDIYDPYHLLKLSKMIFSDLPGLHLNTDETTYSDSKNPISKIIFNSDGYTKDAFGKEDVLLPLEDGKFIKGKPLVLKAGEFIKTSETPENSKGVIVQKDIPIGYNIYLPEGEIKGVIVHVYGGFQTKDRLERLNKPIDLLDSLDTYLMNRGIAIVKLDLLDLLELNIFQLSMPQDIHTKLHASIHQFFQSLRNNDLQSPLYGIIPQTAKIYLYGGSFGGRTALRQAELYPDSFDGYISHDGGISLKELNLPTLTHADNRANTSAMAWLDPVGPEKMKHIIKAILLLHNFDDNNVNIRLSLDFYDAALKNGKGHLVHLLNTPQGNKAPSKIEDVHNKGHFPPESSSAFKRYAHTIADFILQGSFSLPTDTQRMSHETMSEWSAHQYTIFADKYYSQASFEDRFVSEAYRLYKGFFFRKKRTSHVSQPARFKAQERTPQTTESEETDKFNQFWEHLGRPLYVMMRYFDYLSTIENSKNLDPLNAEINFLQTHNTLSDLVVENTLVQQFPPLLEILNLKIPYPVFTKNKLVQNLYRSYLFDKDQTSELKLYLLDNLYKGNPDLTKERLPDWQQKLSKNNLPETQNIAQEKLRQRIGEDKKFILKRLAEMGNLHTLSKQSLGNVAYLLTLMHKNSPITQKKSQVEEFTHFTSGEIKAVNPANIPLEQFDTIFQTILESGITVPENLVSALWQLYLQVLIEQQGSYAHKWGSLPPNVASFFEKYKDTNILKAYTKEDYIPYFSVYLTKQILDLLNTMKLDRSLEEKRESVRKFTQFSPNQIKQINTRDISFDQFENIFDNIIHYDFQSSLDKECLGELWAVFINKYEEKNGSNEAWKEIPPKSAVLYKKYINTDILKDYMIRKDQNAFEKVISEERS